MRALLLAAMLAAASPLAAQAGDVPGRFDFYVLALSWSPDYCAARPQDAEQCGRPYGFVLHGLWPQYQRGYPANCSAEPLQPQIERQFAGLYPSRKLYRHEWDKHGSCSGLSQPQFHQLAASLKAKVRIPAAYQAPAQPLRRSLPQLKADLVAANPWLPASAISVACSGAGRFLQEVRVCFDKQGSGASACSEQMQRAEARSCRQPDLLVRNVR
ncbi:ribonuclease T2 family protein [Vogesella oryzae]|uniref:ribonuclease T2 family protein n=1 Tax=Vogesella oryzae TaxID=1735285 RepID=UPI001581BE2C|nr:ribonuclease [Vogesella oryzae]